jgi:hypothetical protein
MKGRRVRRDTTAKFDGNSETLIPGTDGHAELRQIGLHSAWA